MTEKVGTLIVGGGAIGLSVARFLSAKGQRCLLIEKNSTLGSETSSRSSEVLHAGIYYRPIDLKTKFCIAGRTMLIEYMKNQRIDYQLCGKLIIASQVEEVSKLMKLYENGLNNGLLKLELLNNSKEVHRFESDVVAQRAIFSPYSGIFNTHQVLTSLEVECIENGCDIVTECHFSSAKCLANNRFLVDTSKGPIECDQIVNAAGLYAPYVSSNIKGIYMQSIPRPYYSKGSYFKLCGSPAHKRLKHLIYPLPSNGGLGIHATLDLSGFVKFGPDSEWIRSSCIIDPKDVYKHDLNCVPLFDYGIEEKKAVAFLDCIQRYWPPIVDYSLMPDYCGVRPKLSGPFDNAVADFVVHSDKHHGLPGLYCLYGIESPGWTSSLAIGEFVSALILQKPGD